MKLFEICESLRRRLQSWLLSVNSLAEQLFCTDLLRGLQNVSTDVYSNARRYLPAALFLTLGGPREASMFADCGEFLGGALVMNKSCSVKRSSSFGPRLEIV